MRNMILLANSLGEFRESVVLLKKLVEGWGTCFADGHDSTSVQCLLQCLCKLVRA